MPRRRLATAIAPAAALLTFLILSLLPTWISADAPGEAAAYVLAFGMFFGLPFTYGVAAVILYLPFRVSLVRGHLTPRRVHLAACATGTLAVLALSIALSILDKPVGWGSIALASLFGGIAGLIGGIVFVRIGGPFELNPRAR